MKALCQKPRNLSYPNHENAPQKWIFLRPLTSCSRLDHDKPAPAKETLIAKNVNAPSKVGVLFTFCTYFSTSIFHKNLSRPSANPQNSAICLPFVHLNRAFMRLANAGKFSLIQIPNQKVTITGSL